MAGETIVDMQRGVYRKIYSGFVWGERICAVSIEAEAWFWRLHAIADDLGNLPGDPNRVAVEAGGGRRVTPEQGEAWTQELIDARLVAKYDNDRFIHVLGFEGMQPAGRNGRKIRKYPAHPPEIEAVGNPGESKAIQGDPRESEGIRGNPVPPMPMPMPNPMPTPSLTPTPAIASVTGSANRFIADRQIRTGNTPPGFLEFYNAYPTGFKADRDGLLALWNARGLEAEAQAIVTGLSAWIASERWKTGFVIEAMKFIETKRWRDTPPPPKPVDNFGRPVKPPPKPGPEKLSDAGQAEFKAWWRERSPEQRGEFARSVGVDVNTVDQNVNWRRVPATWSRTGEAS